MAAGDTLHIWQRKSDYVSVATFVQRADPLDVGDRSAGLCRHAQHGAWSYGPAIDARMVVVDHLTQSEILQHVVIIVHSQAVEPERDGNASGQELADRRD